ncbi:bacillithiol biosynthesis cysteine-adding enzyme BshC [Lottiidibacillus patelloidae]|uniref:Putative cysteine ligase BshC n=1 Tax=Lottiidibacillus patelloidae TaxID=2670334 RepID=A0A263BY31_9BACI|nr:bacillithiol biosynthesis cysteine-adding enzyme BshC [Lottiidibacillus patelloidae]OZM58498.1 bacillithiol biosynthesis cysteine-adding enzyme BshC [Lottiidibacillus patelloidae]
MEVVELTLPQKNAFASTYLEQTDRVMSFFHYNYKEQKSFEERRKELAERSFPREKLVHVLTNYNKKFNFTNKTLQNISKLKDANTTVVIGGQQAGLLTGPLYSIHKIISIIQLAEQQEQKLGHPVVPVFWIAGEDHDFQEINHVYTSKQGKISKNIIPHKISEKEPVSHVLIDKQITKKWMREVVATYGDREYTKEILQLLEEKIEVSTSYTDFFAHLISSLLPNSGLILVDAQDHAIRELEGPFFEKLITENEKLQQAIKGKELEMKKEQYSLPFTSDDLDTNLFFLSSGNRVLLERTKQGYYWGKHNEVMLKSDELLTFAKTSPQLLSNNVATRPLMQDYVFPTLAFIAGPGEIAYWGLLKDAFSLYNMKMPPVVPRHMVTIIERHIEKRMAHYQLSDKSILLAGTRSEKEAWLKQQTKVDIDSTFRKVKSELEKIHRNLRQEMNTISPSLNEYGKHNLEYLNRQLTNYENKVKKIIVEQQSVDLKRFDDIDIALRPLQAPQERMWSVIYYINRYGLDFCERLLNLELSFNDKHKIIKL